MENDSYEVVREIRTTKKTIIGIIWSKFTDYLQDSTFKELVRRLFLFLLSIVLTASINYPDRIKSMFLTMARWNNYLILQYLVILFCLFNYPIVHRLIKHLHNYSQIKKKTTKTIDGIPVLELIDHLFEKESFKRDDIEGKFGIPRYRYTALAKKLEEIGVLKRGPNNSRVLNNDYTRQDIYEILNGIKNCRHISPLLRLKKSYDKFWQKNTFTNEPRGNEIKNNIQKHIDKESQDLYNRNLPTGFTIRRI